MSQSVAGSARSEVLRQLSLDSVRQRNSPRIGKPVSSYFGELTFGLGKMRETLPKDAYTSLLKTLEKGEKMSRDTANAVAQVVKDWAVSKGATHFCHWFQPMTGLTAEKHDAFISIQHAEHSELSVVERFTGSQLIQGEPDASSFPSGGMRTTFEARGYTAWDPTSPMFIVESDCGNTLCIPTVFFGYHGQALDTKTPLLRSSNALSKAACDFLKLIGDLDTKKVSASLGAEQEYFLIDRRFGLLRPDITMTGRTLLGAAPARGQQLEDHYFGSIPPRVKSFMVEVEEELYRLGIPVKTRHNEVAPSQFEIAPIFEEANIAVDHNLLTMETLKRVASRHGLICLLHEKPFAELNGSGKHCNWSLSNDKGENLLEPGHTPHQNLRFLAVLSVVLKAVFDRSALLRLSIASPGNDHRLGGNEAPPAIISVFLGSLLSQIFENIENQVSTESVKERLINLGVGQIPQVAQDYTDRNRTSPFAFTGNKFEFRAVGSSANIAVPVTFLNSAVASAFAEATARLKILVGKHKDRDEAVMELVRELSAESKNIRFEGNNYSEEWRQEAEKRGLPILMNTPAALATLEDTGEISFLVETGVLTKDEIASRHHIIRERYVKTVLIEINTMVDVVGTQILPAVEEQIKSVAATISCVASAELKGLLSQRLEKLETAASQVLRGFWDLEKFVLETLTTTEAEQEKAIVENGIPLMNSLRAACDFVETRVDDSVWPLPKYREMLFSNGV
ncbi:MAG: glutamine synthetase type III [Bdellovibrionales bacterium CG10_big_fil_rev_8_21_14_0_10_45_34]|nr:MAG: glutamine synthetase type III [Bdellovibrionales bacterium CG10_big_fil_rev_8_21_14_0_10_45_34]